VLLVVLVDVANVLDDLLVAHMLERLFSGERQHLPEGDGERPNVGL
jgi:hypothetical protein